MEKQQNQKKQELQVLQYGDLVCVGDTDTPGFMAHDQGITDSLSVCKMVRNLSFPVHLDPILAPCNLESQPPGSPPCASPKLRRVR